MDANLMKAMADKKFFDDKNWMQKDWENKQFANQQFLMRQANIQSSYERQQEAARQATISSDLARMDKPSFILKSLIAINSVLLVLNTTLAWLNGDLATEKARQAFKAELQYQRQRALEDTSWKRWVNPGYWMELQRVHKAEAMLIAASDPNGSLLDATSKIREIAKLSPEKQMKLGQDLIASTKDSRVRTAYEALLSDPMKMETLKYMNPQSAHATFLAAMQKYKLPRTRDEQWTPERKAALARAQLAFAPVEEPMPRKLFGIEMGKKRKLKSGLDNDRDYGYRPA